MEAKFMEIKDERMTPQWMETLEGFIGKDGNKFAINLEKSIEENVIKLLRELEITSSVKSDRYSLPAHGSVFSSSGYDSEINYIWNSSAVKREFLKVLLKEDCRKVRFYVYIHSEETNETGFLAMFAKRFIIEIRYYLHD